jgi:hypothetical protein
MRRAIADVLFRAVGDASPPSSFVPRNNFRSISGNYRHESADYWGCHPGPEETAKRPACDRSTTAVSGFLRRARAGEFVGHKTGMHASWETCIRLAR